MLRVYFFCASLFLTLYSNCFAYADKVIERCKLTPVIFLPYIPEKIAPYNNLLRTPGTPEVARGAKIIIQGRVLDENCVPVTDALVEIWQEDAFGN
mgnify:CR=1 FL=1